MQSVIDSSTAFYGAGNAPMRRQFKLRTGPYSGRKLVIYPSDAATIVCRYADAPYSEWSEPLLITANAADYPCGGWLDADGCVYLVYTVQTSLNLAFRKLTFNSGTWMVGEEAIVFDAKANYFAAVVKDSTSRLHVCWTCFDTVAGTYSVRHKRSASDGATWGAGVSDGGSILGEGTALSCCTTEYAAPYVYCIYTDTGTNLIARRLLDGANNWDDGQVLHTGLYLSDKLGSAVSDSQSMVGVVFEATYRLWYAECDGSNWSGAFEIASLSATPPLLVYNGEIPFVIYGVEIGPGQIELRYRFKTGSGFGPEQLLAPESSRFAAVYLYDHDGSPQFHNRTLEAAGTAMADVLATGSGAMVAAVDDALYAGADAPFADLNVHLSTAGNSGAVTWEYFSDSGWRPFVPDSGEYHFDNPAKLLRLWPDSAHAPLDWQKTKVESQSQFWVRARVTVAFTVAPVGTQITPCLAISCLNK